MRNNKENIVEKFGLGYLTGNAAPKSVIDVDTGRAAERSLISVGGKVLTILKNTADKRSSIHELVRQTGIEIETLVGVVERLEELGFVSLIERDDLLKNHLVEMTQLGEESIA